MVVELCNLDKDIFFRSFKDEFFFQKFIQEKIFGFSNSIVAVLNDKKQVIANSVEFAKLFDNDDIYGISFVKLMNRITQLPNDFFQEKNYFIKVNSDNRVFQAEISRYSEDSVKSVRYVIILKDVSDKKEMQTEKDNFIATLTHDLKTPVRADILSLELLLKGRFGKLNTQQHEIINEILNSNKFMMTMLDTLLAKYKYENDDVHLNKINFGVNDFIKTLVKELSSLFNEKNILCKMNLSEEEINIYGDKIELKRAFSNLLSNAIKFNNDNGRVIISVKKYNNNVNISIEDTGIGMSEDKIEHIFDKYVSYAKKFRRLGTGLGLYVAKKIIQAHLGTIDVTSTIDKGSIFTVILPIKN